VQVSVFSEYVFLRFLLRARMFFSAFFGTRFFAAFSEHVFLGFFFGTRMFFSILFRTHSKFLVGSYLFSVVL